MKNVSLVASDSVTTTGAIPGSAVQRNRLKDLDQARALGDRRLAQDANRWTPLRVRRLRGEQTQEDFAHEVGVTFSTVNRWENGGSYPNRIAIRVLEGLERKEIKQGTLDAWTLDPDKLAVIATKYPGYLPEKRTRDRGERKERRPRPVALDKEESPIRTLRLLLNMTQETFAHEVGVTFATVNRWENRRTTPNKVAIKVLRQFARKAHAKELSRQIQELGEHRLRAAREPAATGTLA